IAKYLLILLFANPAFAAEKYQNWCQQGNQQVQSGGVNSSTKVQRSFPTCTITVFVSNPTAVSISSISRTSNVVTVTTGSGYGWINGASVTIAGVTDSSFNGTFVITGVSGTGFTYAQTASNTSSSGGSAFAAARMANIYSDISFTPLSNPFANQSTTT